MDGPKITRNYEVGVKTVVEAGAAVAMSISPEVGAGASQFVRPVLTLVPLPPPMVAPKWLPTSLAIARYANVLALSLSIPDDSGRFYHEFVKRESELTTEITRVTREIKTQEERLRTLRRSPSHLVLTNPEEAQRVDDEAKKIALTLDMLHMQKELLDLYAKKLEDVNSTFGESDVDAMVSNARIHFLESQLKDYPQVAAAKWRNHHDIMASAVKKEGAPAASAGAASETNDPKDAIDWEGLAARGDTTAFVKAVDGQIVLLNAEVVRHIQLGHSAQEIFKWYGDTVLREMTAIDAAAQKLPGTQESRKQLHDVRNRRIVLQSWIPFLLETGRLSEAKSACSPPVAALKTLIANIKSNFRGIDIEMKGLDGIHLASYLNPEDFTHILENVIRNAVEHPNPGQKDVTITIEFTGGILFITDNAEGMDEATLNALMGGVRVHNGTVIVRDTADTEGHGFGTQHIFEYAKKMGFEVEYDSEKGVGTTVAITPIADGFVLDPVAFILEDKGDISELHRMIETMSDDHRRSVMQDLLLIFESIANELLPLAIDTAELHLDRGPLMKRSHEIATRYKQYLDAMLAGHDELNSLWYVQKCQEIARLLETLGISILSAL